MSVSSFKDVIDLLYWTPIAADRPIRRCAGQYALPFFSKVLMQCGAWQYMFSCTRSKWLTPLFSGDVLCQSLGNLFPPRLNPISGRRTKGRSAWSKACRLAYTGYTLSKCQTWELESATRSRLDSSPFSRASDGVDPPIHTVTRFHAASRSKCDFESRINAPLIRCCTANCL